MSEIKRWTLHAGWQEVSLREQADGALVLFTDHEADLIKAKIEELQALARSICFRCEMHDDAEPEVEGADTEYVHWRAGVEEGIQCHATKIHSRIAQLQAQLGEAGR